MRQRREVLVTDFFSIINFLLIHSTMSSILKKIDMIFITLKQFLTISHTNITYLLDDFSNQSYLRIFCWRLGRTGRPVSKWFHFFGKLLESRETLVSWQLAPITWRAVCPPWWLVVVHVWVVPGGINDLLAIWCERVRMNDGHSDWKILFSNALHCCFFYYPALVLWGPVSNLL